jgi:C4-dicarboxylate transporter, DctQ subunit
MGSFFGAIDKFFEEFEKGVLGFGIILLSIVVILNIVTRSLLGWSWIGTEEFSKFCVIWITFMGTSLGTRGDRHISMTAFVDMTSLNLKNTILTVVGFVTAIFCFYISYLGFRFTILSMGGGMVTPALMVPVWPFYIPLPIGLLLTGIHYIRLSLRRMGVGVVEQSAAAPKERFETE